MDWALTHLEGVKSHCSYQVEVNQPLPAEVLADPSYTDITNDTFGNNTITNVTLPPTQNVVPVFTPDFLAKIEEISCLNECNGKGICLNGKFTCSYSSIHLRGRQHL